IPPSYVLQEADGFGIHLLSNGLPLYIPEEGLSTDHIQASDQGSVVQRRSSVRRHP
ncbi:hypothetical protein Pmar_PMAR018902, partial [Perkinsus marinus ATCC 50983]